MIKNASFFDLKTNNLVTHELDNDACIGNDIDTVNAIDFSLRKIDNLDTDTPKISLYDLSIDEGGGSTGFGLER